VRGRTRPVPLGEAAGKIVGVIVVPSIPGMPIALPGERIGTNGSATIRYLQAIEAFNRTFPGFEHDVHGIEHDDDRSFLLRVVVDERRRLTVLPARTEAREPHGAAGR